MNELLDTAVRVLLTAIPDRVSRSERNIIRAYCPNPESPSGITTWDQHDLASAFGVSEDTAYASLARRITERV